MNLSGWWFPGRKDEGKGRVVLEAYTVNKVHGVSRLCLDPSTDSHVTMDKFLKQMEHFLRIVIIISTLS